MKKKFETNNSPNIEQESNGWPASELVSTYSIHEEQQPEIFYSVPSNFSKPNSNFCAQSYSIFDWVKEKDPKLRRKKLKQDNPAPAMPNKLSESSTSSISGSTAPTDCSHISQDKVVILEKRSLKRESRGQKVNENENNDSDDDENGLEECTKDGKGSWINKKLERDMQARSIVQSEVDLKDYQSSLKESFGSHNNNPASSREHNTKVTGQHEAPAADVRVEKTAKKGEECNPVWSIEENELVEQRKNPENSSEKGKNRRKGNKKGGKAIESHEHTARQAEELIKLESQEQFGGKAEDNNQNKSSAQKEDQSKSHTIDSQISGNLAGNISAANVETSGLENVIRLESTREEQLSQQKPKQNQGSESNDHDSQNSNLEAATMLNENSSKKEGAKRRGNGRKKPDSVLATNAKDTEKQSLEEEEGASMKENGVRNDEISNHTNSRELKDKVLESPAAFGVEVKYEKVDQQQKNGENNQSRIQGEPNSVENKQEIESRLEEKSANTGRKQRGNTKKAVELEKNAENDNKSRINEKNEILSQSQPDCSVTVQLNSQTVNQSSCSDLKHAVKLDQNAEEPFSQNLKEENHKDFEAKASDIKIQLSQQLEEKNGTRRKRDGTKEKAHSSALSDEKEPEGQTEKKNRHQTNEGDVVEENKLVEKTTGKESEEKKRRKTSGRQKEKKAPESQDNPKESEAQSGKDSQSQTQEKYETNSQSKIVSNTADPLPSQNANGKTCVETNQAPGEFDRSTQLPQPDSQKDEDCFLSNPKSHSQQLSNENKNIVPKETKLTEEILDKKPEEGSAKEKIQMVSNENVKEEENRPENGEKLFKEPIEPNGQTKSGPSQEEAAAVYQIHDSIYDAIEQAEDPSVGEILNRNAEPRTQNPINQNNDDEQAGGGAYQNENQDQDPESRDRDLQNDSVENDEPPAHVFTNKATESIPSREKIADKKSSPFNDDKEFFQFSFDRRCLQIVQQLPNGTKKGISTISPIAVFHEENPSLLEDVDSHNTVLSQTYTCGKKTSSNPADLTDWKASRIELISEEKASTKDPAKEAKELYSKNFIGRNHLNIKFDDWTIVFYDFIGAMTFSDKWHNYQNLPMRKIFEYYRKPSFYQIQHQSTTTFSLKKIALNDRIPLEVDMEFNFSEFAVARIVEISQGKINLNAKRNEVTQQTEDKRLTKEDRAYLTYLILYENIEVKGIDQKTLIAQDFVEDFELKHYEAVKSINWGTPLPIGVPYLKIETRVKENGKNQKSRILFIAETKSEIVKIGRHANSDLMLSHNYCSRQHAEISYDKVKCKWILRDGVDKNPSKKGSFFNLTTVDQRTKSASKWYPLDSGMFFKITEELELDFRNKKLEVHQKKIEAYQKSQK